LFIGAAITCKWSGMSIAAKNLPIVEFADGRLECFECEFICQTASTIRDTNRDEINHALLPW
jgi:hypothetical protein